jgi:DNA-directed RNA polymerase subunit RPC12/RpoP
VKYWQISLAILAALPGHTSSSPGDFGTIFVIVLVVGLCVLAIYASKKPKTVSPAKLARLQSEAKEFIDKLVATGKITVPDTPVVLGTDETALLHEPSKLIEARATRVYAGAGTRVRGIYIGGGESRSVQSLKELDSGTLTLTTKRLVFTGSMESRVVNIKDIVSIEPFADAIQISPGKRAKRQVYLVHNPIIWATLIRTTIKGGVSTTAKPVASSADIRFNCPRCGQHLAVEQRGEGMAVNCPSCNEQIEIPGSTAPPLPL